MKPLFVLLTTFLISSLFLKFGRGKYDFYLSGRVAMGTMLIFTAIAHFVFTEGMTAMIPEIVPFKKEMVYFTGILEIAFAIGLLLPNYKVMVAWMLIVFFLLILPANIKASIENINYQTGELNGNGLLYLWFRIPLQLFFIGWVYFTTSRN